MQLDHDHETGMFRGWLCHRCNTGIGSLGDSAEGLENALRYVRSGSNMATPILGNHQTEI